MEQQRSTSPAFYKNAAILFFVIGGILVWQAIAHHDWVYWAFAAITLLNARMAIAKFRKVRETKIDGQDGDSQNQAPGEPPDQATMGGV